MVNENQALSPGGRSGILPEAQCIPSDYLKIHSEDSGTRKGHGRCLGWLTMSPSMASDHTWKMPALLQPNFLGLEAQLGVSLYGRALHSAPAFGAAPRSSRVLSWRKADFRNHDYRRMRAGWLLAERSSSGTTPRTGKEMTPNTDHVYIFYLYIK